MDTSYLEQHLHLSAEEKREAMVTVNALLQLGEEAQKYGLLPLVRELRSKPEIYHNPLLQIGVSYLADGVDPDELRKLLENYLVSSHITGKEFLCALAVIEGLTGIQQGVSLYVIAERICSYFGLDFRTEFVKSCRLSFANVPYEDIYKDKKPFSEKTRLLDKYISMQPRSLQRLLREIEPDTLCVALYGSTYHILSLFFQNMSERNVCIIHDRMQAICPEEAEIIDAQKSIDIIAKQLAKQGEIIE